MPRHTGWSILVLAAFAGTASAQALDENVVHIDQIGADNSAVIDQSGVRNQAGRQDDPLWQDGFWNDLQIRQNGNRNTIGTEGTGLYQQGRFTTETVHNRIVIDQFSDDNVIGTVEQLSEGAVPNGANDMTLVQSGGDRNRINIARQVQETGDASQEMILRQTGADNVIDLASQTANSSVDDKPNIMRVRMSGSFNGRDRLSGAAAIPLLRDSAFVQEGGAADPRANGNFMDVEIAGNDTAIGIRQGGRDNSVGFITINGNGNDLGIRQDGDQNDVVLSVVEGDGNAIGIDQLQTNLATVSLIGDSSDNALLVQQQGTNDAFLTLEGDRNNVSAVQDFRNGLGGENTLSVAIEGDDNQLVTDQRGSNTATIGIEGNRNNTRRLIVPGAVQASAGLVEQLGFDNAADISVLGDDNVFAVLQDGFGNLVSLLQDGDENDAIIFQGGSGNDARVRQVGAMNFAFVRQ
ncbi:hypothetical protein BOO69_14370 [Sulfitobacter alexandrii]|uniref:Curlin associated repeat-containing protein n=1 Tax=Sulfitobacter alexandrii TaxID=1917485 RepID=A0A1J0WJG5_9RHOB|nr:hypothetical protein [Sulfitobacter alexandrii]APE44465.1 hypothetical protein BOO69_14370 [Sulfitobacter alexandrii]